MKKPQFPANPQIARERVTRLELATSTLAKKMPVIGQRNAIYVTLVVLYCLSFAFLAVAAKPIRHSRISNAHPTYERAVNMTLDTVEWVHEQAKGKITWAQLNNEVCRHMQVKRTQPWERK